MTMKPTPWTVLLTGVFLITAPSLLHAAPLTMAHGWSVNPEGGRVAAEEAIAMMERVVDSPRFIVLYTTAGYGEEEIAATLRNRFPEAKLFGMNVYKGVFTSDGLHIGEKGSLAVMGFSGGDLGFGVGVRAMPEGGDASTVTKEAFADAIRDAGRSSNTLPAVVLLGAMKGKEDAVVKGIGQVLSKDVPLVGGTHCDDRFGQGFVIGNDKICKPGILVGLIYSQGKIGSAYHSGFVGQKKSGTITDGDGRLLKAIDGLPAQEVYRDWAEGHFDDIDTSEKSVLVMSSAVCPLAKAIHLPSGKLRYIPVRPWRFNPDGSLNMGGDIHEGDTIYYVEGNARALRRRASVVARNAMVEGRIKMKECVGGLYIYCAGAAKTLGLDPGGGTEKMVEEIREAIGERPFIGGFTAGEQGNIPGYGFFHGNLMSSTVVFAK